jgi:hypothetical protein
MLEKRFYAVPAQAFTANGTTAGVITIGTDACTLFKVKQRVLVKATGLPTLTLEIKEIDGVGNIQVGPIAGTLKVPGQNTGISARTDISAYTVILGANISADEQRRPDIDYAELMRAVYDEEPAVALRNVIVDECGSRITQVNPFPINIYPATDIPFTLGALTLPTLVENLVKTLTFDQVTSDTTGNQETLTFYLQGNLITTAVISKTMAGWVLDIATPPVEDLLLLEYGAYFELEDGTGGILLEN